MGNWRLVAMRYFVDVYRLGTLPLAERFFANRADVVDTPLFGYLLPTQVSRTGMHRLLCLMRERFIDERHLFFNILKCGDVVIDVGANIGYILLLFESRVGPSGRVICIEPEPDNLEELRDCIAANALANVRVLDVAVGASNGEIRVRRGLNSGICDEGEDGISVPMICLNSLLDENPDLVKIDIEGFEGQALAGAQELMRKVTPALFVEVHPMLLRHGYSVSDICDLVRPYYEDLQFFEPVKEGTLLQKIAARYRARGGVRQIGSENEVIERCRSGSLKEPFWMICR